MVDGRDNAWRSRAPGPHARKHSEAGDGRPVDRGAWTAKTVKRPRQQPAQPQYANYWEPLTRKRHTMPHSAQPQHTNHWAPRARKRHQQEPGRSGRQNAATRRNMRREERVTVQGPVKKQQPDGMSHRGGGGDPWGPLETTAQPSSLTLQPPSATAQPPSVTARQ